MSEEIRQTQKAGDNAQQLQVQNLTIVNGIDEKRAREIYREMFEISRKDFTQDAYQIANARVGKFEDKLIPKMQKIDGALNNFADPAFQLLLSKAHKTAAATEREADYELLSELLIHRINKGTERKTAAGINRAVEIVDQIDDDALCGLTVFHSVETFTPVTGNIISGLSILNDLFEKIMYRQLPEGNEWIEHLDLLGAIRIVPFSSLNKITDFYKEVLNGYVCLGINKTSNDYRKILEILEKNGIPLDIFIENEFYPEYMRLNIPNENSIDNTLSWSIKANVNFPILFSQIIKPSKNQCKVLHDIWDMYEKNSEKQNIVNEKFSNKFTSFSSLLYLRNWWDNISISFNITSVGKVLAHANAQRCDNKLPPLRK